MFKQAAINDILLDIRIAVYSASLIFVRKWCKSKWDNAFIINIIVFNIENGE